MFTFSAILILPNKLSDDQELESKYYVDPDTCDLSELMVVENVVSGHEDVVALFWENKLGVDVDVRTLPSMLSCSIEALVVAQVSSLGVRLET